MKNKKNIIILAVLILIVGAVFLFKFRSVQKKYDINSSEVTSINVYDSCNKVEVKPSEDDKIHVIYHDRKSAEYTINTSGGVLNISNKSKDSNGEVNAGISFSSTVLEIKVPKDFKGEFISTTFDKCEVDKSINFSKVDSKSMSDMLGM